MILPNFTEVQQLSESEIIENIHQTENKLFNLRLQKATRQNLKYHEIKNEKRRLAQLKTILKLRLQKIEKN